MRAARGRPLSIVAMSFPDIVPDLKAQMPALRGRLMPNQSLAPS